MRPSALKRTSPTSPPGNVANWRAFALSQSAITLTWAEASSRPSGLKWIPEADRVTAISFVHEALRPGGFFALWENNPWNPGTRYVMHRNEFDKDATMLAPPKARHLLLAGGFEVVSTDFLFIFPKALRWLRGIEPAVSRLPFGGQYQILCRKPM